MSRRRGFTLVELLVVIGIIAVLLSILLPTLARARAQGLSIKCLSNLKQLGSAMINYTLDNQGFFPDSQSTADPNDDWLRPSDFPNGALCKYTGPIPALYRCPADTNCLKETCPYSYAMNSQFVLFRITQVVQSSEKIVFVDDLLHNDNVFWYFATPANKDWNDATRDGLSLRHSNNTGNVVYADGHADTLTQSHENDPKYYEAYAGQGWVRK